MNARDALALLLALSTGACAGPDADVAAGSGGMIPARPLAIGSRGKIRHVIVVVQENRSFDNFFATFPGADGARSGATHSGAVYPLKKSTLVQIPDLCHSYKCYRWDYDQKKMDGFDTSAYFVGATGLAPYQYVDPAQIRPYWTLAQRYVLADRMFQTQGSASFTAHQDLIAGDTPVDPYADVIDVPDASAPWGCDAPAGTTTPTIGRFGAYSFGGPFPCFTYRTIRDLLDAAHVTWKYYTPSLEQRKEGGWIWNAFEAIDAVRHGPEWRTNVSSPNTNFFADITAAALPNVSWVIPDGIDSDHPGRTSDTGPSWVAQIVNAVGKSKYWDSTAIVIVWDDWGGLYDHVPPPQLGYGGLGFRVPGIIVSAYAKKGYVSHTQYEFASILKFVEDNWRLGRLNRNDRRANSIVDSFDFAQRPRPFAPITAKYTLQYFLHRPPSNVPVDDE
ncbi:MAG TPA: alkaline phosphatase family protein [Candidatus Baltobacteraceae bacterium]